MKNTQKGRSMVEMLGVLAIIGVLSVGGIAGYTVAMNRYRANQILDMASKLAVIAQTMNAGAGGDACAGTGCPAGTDVGLTWTTTGGVTRLEATYRAEGVAGGENVQAVAAAADNVDVTLTGNIPAGVQNAMESIAGTATYTVGTDVIHIATN